MPAQHWMRCALALLAAFAAVCPAAFGAQTTFARVQLFYASAGDCNPLARIASFVVALDQCVVFPGGGDDAHATYSCEAGDSLCSITTYSQRGCLPDSITSTKSVMADGSCRKRSDVATWFESLSLVQPVAGVKGPPFFDGLQPPLQYYYFDSSNCSGHLNPGLIQEYGGCRGSKYLPLDPPAVNGSSLTSCVDNAAGGQSVQLCMFPDEKCSVTVGDQCSKGPGLLPSPLGKCAAFSDGADANNSFVFLCNSGPAAGLF